MLDVLGLAFLRAATEQNHKLIAILAKIDAIAWAEGDASLRYALPYWLHVAKVAGLDPRKRGSYLQGCDRIELVKLIIERCFSLVSDIDNKLNHKKQW